MQYLSSRCADSFDVLGLMTSIDVHVGRIDVPHRVGEAVRAPDKCPSNVTYAYAFSTVAIESPTARDLASVPPHGFRRCGLRIWAT